MLFKLNGLSSFATRASFSSLKEASNCRGLNEVTFRIWGPSRLERPSKRANSEVWPEIMETMKNFVRKLCDFRMAFRNREGYSGTW